MLTWGNPTHPRTLRDCSFNENCILSMHIQWCMETRAQGHMRPIILKPSRPCLMQCYHSTCLVASKKAYKLWRSSIEINCESFQYINTVTVWCNALISMSNSTSAWCSPMSIIGYKWADLDLICDETMRLVIEKCVGENREKLHSQNMFERWFIP